MNKHFIAIFAIALVISGCSTNPPQYTPSTGPGPAGPDATQAEAPQTAAPQAPVAAPRTKETRVYRLVVQELAYPDGLVSGEVRNTYDDKGRILKEEQLNGTKALVSRKVYDYRTAGKIEVQHQNDAGKLLGRSVQELKGDLVMKIISFNPLGEEQSTEDFLYDRDGRKIRWTVKTAGGNQTATDYVWKDGRLVQKTIRDATGAVIKTYTSAFDKDGNLLSETEAGPDGSVLGKTTYAWQNGGLVRIELQNAQGAVLSAQTMVNDAKGNPVKVTVFDRRGREVEIRNQTWQEYVLSVEIK